MITNSQIEQLILWIGVILIIPTFSRFCYVVSSAAWRKIFPTNTFEIKYLDEESGFNRVVTVKVPRRKGKILVNLIDDAINSKGPDK